MNLARQIADVAHDLPESIVRGFCESLAEHGTASGYPRDRILGHVPSVDSRKKLAVLLNAAHDAGVSTESLILALEAAFQSHRHWRTSQSLEIVWTGPSPAHSTLRRTDQALLEVVRSARHELWIVSFAAYRVRVVVDALKQAIGRGVQVSLVLESTQASEGRYSGDQISVLESELGEAARIFIWPTDQRQESQNGHRGMLHAKCAVADHDRLFVSSANLTEAAMSLNIELGVLTTGEKPAKLVHSHLTWLVESEILQRI